MEKEQNLLERHKRGVTCRNCVYWSRLSDLFLKSHKSHESRDMGICIQSSNINEPKIGFGYPMDNPRSKILTGIDFGCIRHKPSDEEPIVE